MTEQKLTELLRNAYRWGRDNGSNKSVNNFNDFLQTEVVQEGIKRSKALSKPALPHPALKLAGKMAIRASDVIYARALDLSDKLQKLDESVKEYNAEIFSRQ